MPGIFAARRVAAHNCDTARVRNLVGAFVRIEFVANVAGSPFRALLQVREAVVRSERRILEKPLSGMQGGLQGRGMVRRAPGFEHLATYQLDTLGSAFRLLVAGYLTIKGATKSDRPRVRG